MTSACGFWESEGAECRNQSKAYLGPSSRLCVKVELLMKLFPPKNQYTSSASSCLARGSHSSVIWGVCVWGSHQGGGKGSSLQLCKYPHVVVSVEDQTPPSKHMMVPSADTCLPDTSHVALPPGVALSAMSTKKRSMTSLAWSNKSGHFVPRWLVLMSDVGSQL